MQLCSFKGLCLSLSLQLLAGMDAPNPTHAGTPVHMWECLEDISHLLQPAGCPCCVIWGGWQTVQISTGNQRWRWVPVGAGNFTTAEPTTTEVWRVRGGRNHLKHVAGQPGPFEAIIFCSCRVGAAAAKQLPVALKGRRCLYQ